MSHAFARSRRGLPRVATALFAMLLVTGLATGVAGALDDGSPSPAASANTLKVQFGTTFDVDDLNPFVGRNGTSSEILHLNYDFLVGCDTDLSPRPELATSWETSPDGRVWTFTLREGVKWQDGKSFTAADVVFTFMYIIDNHLAKFTGYTKDIEKVEALDEFTVRMTCSRPKADMLRLRIPILPKHVWSKVPGERAGSDYVSEPPVVGTGPFQTVEVKKGGYVKLVKNPAYWKQGKPAIDELFIAIYQSAAAMTRDLEAGTLDYAQGIPAAPFEALAGEASLTASAADRRYFDELCMNCYDSPDSLGHPVLRDPRFRQAISWAVDKQKIVDFTHGGYAAVGQSIITPDVPVYAWSPAPVGTFGFDLEKARQLLDEAGYKDANGDGVRDYKGKPIDLRLWARSDDVAGQTTGELVAGWFTDIGLTITLRTLDPGTIGDALRNRKGSTYAPDFDIYIRGRGEYVDPDYILNAYTTGQIARRNDPSWSNAEYDRLYERQARSIDPAKRKPLVDRMQQILYAEAPCVVTDYVQQLEAYDSDKWDGWTQVPEGSGPVAFINDSIDTYLNLRPRVAAADAGGSGGSISLIYVVVAVAVAAVAIVAVLLLRRGRGRATEG